MVSICLIKEIKESSDQNERLSLIKKLKDILPQETIDGEDRLRAFNLVQASRLALDISDHENFLSNELHKLRILPINIFLDPESRP